MQLMILFKPRRKWLRAICCVSPALLVGLAFLLVMAGCATKPPNLKGATGGDDKLVPGDIIVVKIQGVPDPPSYEGPIDENGEIQVFYLNKIKAAGYTADEFAERLKYLFIERQIYSPNILPTMLVTVTVATRFYYITGEVGGRGRFPLVGPLTVCKALIAVGGAGEFSNMKKVIVHRGGQKIRVNCIRAAGDSKYDIDIKAGDVIEVPKKGMLPFL